MIDQFKICFDIIWVVFAADTDHFDQKCLRGVVVLFYSVRGTEFLAFSTTFSEGGDGTVEAESVTGRICREIDEARKKFGHVISPLR